MSQTPSLDDCIVVNNVAFPVRKTKYHYLQETYDSNQAEMTSYRNVWVENMTENRPFVKKTKNIDHLFKDPKWGQFECVVVGAGPSLEFDLPALKRYRKNIKIICVDTAFNVLMKQGIEPDFVFTRNHFQSTQELLSGHKSKNAALVASVFQSPQILRKWKGDVYAYMPFDDDYYYEYLIENTKEIPKLLLKPDTFSMAVILARLMKFKRIFLLGADYCFADPKKLYCPGVLYPAQSVDENETRVFTIDSIFFDIHNKVRTTKALFNQSEELFRLIMVENPDQVVNCSRVSILYNLNWVYFEGVMEYEGKSKNNYFEFSSMHYNSGNEEVQMSNELTTNYFKAIISRNMFDNRERVRRERTIVDILNPDAQRENSTKNCIVCGTGPSLLETIPVLREHREKFTVIAVDSSVYPLYKHGVDADLVLTIDAAAHCGDYLKDYAGERARLVGSVGSHPHTIGSWKNGIYFYFPTPVKSFYFWLLMMLGYEKIPFLMPLNNCGSTSVILAHDLGFRNVAITGIDFSYTRNRMYVEGANVDSVLGRDEIDSEERVEKLLTEKGMVKSVDCRGNQVITDATFDFYARSLYSVSRARKYDRIVNVGGGILKFPYMPMDEYIDKVILEKTIF